MRLSRTRASLGLSDQIWEWQFMQTSVAGTPAKEAVFHGGVAEAAVESEAGDVVAVAEVNRLGADDVGLGVVVRGGDGVSDGEAGDEEEEGAEDRDLGERVRRRMEDLGHFGAALSMRGDRRGGFRVGHRKLPTSSTLKGALTSGDGEE